MRENSRVLFGILGSAGGAGLAALNGDGERAALLLGIAKTLVGRTSTAHRELVSDFGAALERGAALAYDQAIALLTGESGNSPRARSRSRPSGSRARSP
ncbi:hypothetical protein [Saccharopolyspora sp. ASAGF58]|uniref:hypothetical protein n=1 Tax=Saccharopolyspora sp. ASAGF58 TaxID=2719023 RepID=UPI00143FF937|nr:hypothetical protein [Saccharopolyspora sp. ASAGF58]QIZ38128.1 hypothetical protein FDZ84_30630 [Saccharopolyspora sp. ASAGF58]